MTIKELSSTTFGSRELFILSYDIIPPSNPPRCKGYYYMDKKTPWTKLHADKALRELIKNKDKFTLVYISRSK